MGTARLAVYLIGLLVVIAGVWIFLTQTPIGRSVPPGVALALILLLVGIGVMASASNINDRRYSRRVVHDAPPVVGGTRVYDTRYAPPPAEAYVGPATGETIVDERRLD